MSWKETQMPSAEELEQMLEPSLVGYLQNEAETHGWTQEEYERLLNMETSKARQEEHHVDA